MRSRTALITFLHYLDPLPSEIVSSLDSLEKLILISFNEAVNIKILTGTKSFLNQVMRFIHRLFNDPAMRSFANDFLNNHVMKPSVQVIKKIMSDNQFLLKDSFDSEIDASMYPLPKFIYHIVKSIAAKNLSLFKELKGLLINSVSVLLGHSLAKSVVNKQEVTIQVKYLGLAAKLLTIVRAGL